MTFESYVHINQVNAKIGNNTKRKLAIQVNKAALIVDTPKSMKMLDWILNETATDLNAQKSKGVV